MKTSPARYSLSLLLALSALVSVNAQTINFLLATRQVNYLQTDASTVSLASNNPYAFSLGVEGDSLMTASNPISAATVTTPTNEVLQLLFDAMDQSWSYHGNTLPTLNDLTTTYPNGAYTFNLTGTAPFNGSQAISVSDFSNSLLSVPTLTLSGGNWVNGSYVIASSATLTIAMNAAYTGSPSSTQGYHYDVNINGSGNLGEGPNDFINYDPTSSTVANYVSTPPNYVINANTLSAGNYQIQVNYDDIQNPAPIFTSAFGAGLYEVRTTVNVTVVPEPSTYAVIFGALALGGVMIRRRRRC